MDNSMISDVRDRIAKLLAMAEHPNSNEHEAATAAEMAQRLLLQHNLSRADLATGDTTGPAGVGKLDIIEAVGYTWKRYLLHTLAVTNLCETVGDTHANTSHLFGTYDNVQAVVEMYRWLVPQLEDIGARSWARYKRDGTGRESARTWKHGFFMGAIKAIYEKMKPTIDEFASGPGHAIVPYNTQLVKDAVRRVYPYTGKSRSSSRSYDGYAAGRQAGGNITLRPQRKLSGVLALR